MEQEICSADVLSFTDFPLLYYEDVKETFAGQVISSEIRLATEKEVEDCRKGYNNGDCPHNIIYDIPGWMYDIRKCGICDKFLGMI